MKRVFFSLSLCFLVAVASAQSTAQPARTSGTSVFVAAGPTFSKFTGAGTDDASLLVGGQLGVGVNLRIANNFSLVPELQGSLQGTKGDFPSDYKYRLWYLNLPVVARYQFGGSGIYAETGPQFGLLLDAKKVVNDSKTDVENAFKKTNVNWVFGAGYNITENVGVGVRVAPGLTDIAETSISDVKQFTSALRLTFGF